MFSKLFWGSFGSPGVSCIKLPAAVAFPTDGRLLQRIEESRRALPATNNMKPLRKSRDIVADTLDAESPSTQQDLSRRVVPLARVAGSMGRARHRISVSAA